LPRWLAYAHPAWMVVALGLALVALRLGLTLRRARLRGTPAPRGTRRLHLRVAKLAVAFVLLGFLAGPLSVWGLRDWTPLSTFHGLVGGVAAVLFAGAAAQGRRLERGDREARTLHAWLGAGALLAGLVAAMAGFDLLP